MPVLVTIKYRVPTTNAINYGTGDVTRVYSDTYQVQAQYAPSSKVYRTNVDVESAIFLLEESELPSSLSPTARHHIEYNSKLYEIDETNYYNRRYVCKCHCVGLLPGAATDTLIQPFSNTFYNLNHRMGEELRYYVPTTNDVDFETGWVVRQYSQTFICRGAATPIRRQYDTVDEQTVIFLLYGNDLPYDLIPSARHHIEYRDLAYEIERVKSYGPNYVLYCKCIGLAYNYFAMHDSVVVGQTIAFSVVTDGYQYVTSTVTIDQTATGSVPSSGDNFFIQHGVLGLGF